VIVNSLDTEADAPAHEPSWAEAVFTPQLLGFDRGARSPPLKRSVIFANAQS
jgi:hypothetical protein